jgi:hypothetical protein
MASDIFSRARGQLLEAVRKVSPAPFLEAPLYRCDATELRPSRTSRSVVNYRADKNDDSTSRWGIEGLRTGSAKVAVQPAYENFVPDIFAIDPVDDCPPVLSGPLTLSLLFPEYRPISNCVSVNVTGTEKALEVASTQVFSYNSFEGTKRPTDYSPPRRVTESALFAAADTSNSAKTGLTIEQIGSNKWRMVQEVEGAPASVDDAISTWNQVTLWILNRPGPQPIRVRVNSNVSGTCQGMHARLTAETTDSKEDDGNEGCPNEWTLTAFSPPGQNSVATLDIGVFVIGGSGTTFGPGKGTVTTEIELLDTVPAN